MAVPGANSEEKSCWKSDIGTAGELCSVVVDNTSVDIKAEGTCSGTRNVEIYVES